ncbi:GDSL-type esterase/lipase family protein [Flammeovirga sp. SJP92]|uniref:SGNH/GDSL hydrolase family protein n=1 Tax=Flammeovirga sp. SJP92 TaxID=1775430 RepID=UPI0007897835|nr:GDSL-type esterase/lipase family protein [Flammeovirga sp. SJP92]KXX71791.1 hypothetical protein AVL50_03125 [Flammeovirga sp. SJP92]
MKNPLILLLGLLLCSCSDDPEITTNTTQNIYNATADTSAFKVPDRALDMLALGDSYTIGASVSKEYRWNEQLKEELEYRKYNINEITYIAQTGWTTKNLIDAIDRTSTKEEYDIVTLLIGVNNQYQRIDIEVFRTEYNQLLQTAINFAGGDPSKVIVLSIPDYGYTYTIPSTAITQEIDLYNSIKESITRRNYVAFHNITSFTRQVKERPELVASDGLHPSGALYKLWVDDIIRDVYEQFLEPVED